MKDENIDPVELAEEFLEERPAKTFESDHYWIDRGKTYREEFEAKRLRKKISFWIQEYYIDKALEWIKRINEPWRILDYGCGFGRITRRLCQKFPYAQINGIDISRDQLAEAVKDMPRVGFIEGSITDSAYTSPNGLVTAVELLMHITPEKIESAIETIKYAIYGEGFVLTVDWWTEDAVDIWAAAEAGFCFLHDYAELFEAQGFELFSEKKIPLVAQKLRIWRLNK